MPSQPPLDIAQLLRRFEVPDAQARLAADHVKATYGEALNTMHGSQVLAAAHAHAPHLGYTEPLGRRGFARTQRLGTWRVEACLRMQAEPNVPDANGETPLHLAARHGHPGIVRRLIEAGADPALGNPAGDPCMWRPNTNARSAAWSSCRRRGPWAAGQRRPQTGDVHRVRRGSMGKPSVYDCWSWTVPSSIEPSREVRCWPQALLSGSVIAALTYPAALWLLAGAQQSHPHELQPGTDWQPGSDGEPCHRHHLLPRACRGVLGGGQEQATFGTLARVGVAAGLAGWASAWVTRRGSSRAQILGMCPALNCYRGKRP